MARAAKAGSRVDAALLLVCALVSLLAIVLPAGTRGAVAAGLQRTLARPFLALQQRSERARAALSERDRLIQRLDSLVLRDVATRQLSQENESLRGLLGIASRLRRSFVAAEALHGELPGESHTLVLTVGNRAGVEANSAVVSPEGLVGRVTFVGPTTSHAILWSHPDFRVSAMSLDGETFGIATPHLATAEECRGMDETACASADRMLLELRGVAYRDALDTGTVVVSTGLGGVYPRGIAIGTVIGEIKTTEQWARSYLVRPAVRPGRVSSVMVLTSLRGQDLGAIWQDSAMVEAMRQRAIAGGDSIERMRQAAADSVRARVVRDSLAALAPRDSTVRRPQ